MLCTVVAIGVVVDVLSYPTVAGVPLGTTNETCNSKQISRLVMVPLLH